MNATSVRNLTGAQVGALRFNPLLPTPETEQIEPDPIGVAAMLVFPCLIKDELVNAKCRPAPHLV